MRDVNALRALDSEIHASMAADADTGAADGFYTAPGANSDVAVQLYINRAAQVLGEFGQVTGRRVELGVLLGDGFELATGGRILIEDVPRSGVGEIWQLDKRLSDDGALAVWAVRRV